MRTTREIATELIVGQIGRHGHVNGPGMVYHCEYCDGQETIWSQTKFSTEERYHREGCVVLDVLNLAKTSPKRNKK